MKESRLYSNVQTGTISVESENAASIKGIVTKTFILLLITASVAIGVAITFMGVIKNNPVTYYGVLILSIILAFIFALTGRVSIRAAKVCSVGYALCEGIFVGSVTRIVELYVKGAGVLCVFATLIIYGIMLILYGSGYLRVDNSRGRGILQMLGRLMISCLIIGLTLALFTLIVTLIRGYDSSTFMLYVLVEVILLFYGVFSLALNFGEASAVVSSGCDKRYEWMVSLGMEISLIYIYIRMLYLVLEIAGRRK